MSLRVATLILAATFTLPVPNEGWHFTFDTPRLESPQTSKAAQGFAFRGNAQRFPEPADQRVFDAFDAGLAYAVD